MSPKRVHVLKKEGEMQVMEKTTHHQEDQTTFLFWKIGHPMDMPQLECCSEDQDCSKCLRACVTL